jgi:DNA-binding transcriptional MerR regulator
VTGSERAALSEKAPDAFRTISEVADDLALPQHVLRFWETRFAQIKPLKRGGGRRYYRPDDVDLLRGIKFLLYGEGYTIKGVQRILKAQGVKFVQMVWRDPGSLAAAAERARESGGFEGDDEPEEIVAVDEDEAPEAAPLARQPVAVTPTSQTPRAEPPPFVMLERRPLAPPGAPATPAPESPRRLILKPPEEERETTPRIGTRDPAAEREDVRRLQATLFELMEAKRLLDAALRRPSIPARGGDGADGN